MQQDQWELDADAIAELVEEGDFDEAFRAVDGSAPWLMNSRRMDMLKRIESRVTNAEKHKRFLAQLTARSSKRP